MLILSPEILRFEDLTWEDAIGVAVDTQAHRLVEEWSDLGPFQAFADIPERRTTVRVTRRLNRSEPELDGAPNIGRQGTLVFYSSNELSDAGRSKISIHCVLVSVQTELGAGKAAARAGAQPLNGSWATQELTFIATSPDGGETDPIQITPAELTD